MNCPKHKFYKGIKYPSSGCPTCLSIYNLVQETLKSQKKFKSLTSPMDCGLLHILAEMSVIMLYGPQKEFFWRKVSSSPEEVKEHYKKVYQGMVQWQKNNSQLFEGVDFLLYKIYKEYEKRNIANSIASVKDNKIQREEVKVSAEAIDKFLGESNDKN